MRPSADRIPLAVRRWIIKVMPEPQWLALRPLIVGETRLQHTLKHLRAARARARARLMDGAIEAFHYRGAVRYGHVVNQFDAEKVKRGTLARVGTVLTQGDTAWALLDEEISKAPKIVVPRTERGRAVRALNVSLREGP